MAPPVLHTLLNDAVAVPIERLRDLFDKDHVAFVYNFSSRHNCKDADLLASGRALNLEEPDVSGLDRQPDT